MNKLITPIVCQHCEQDWKHGACGDCSLTRKQLDACIDLQKQLQQAHREGWEQAKAEAVKAVKPEVYPNNKYIVNTIFQCAVAIAAMEYKEKVND